MSAACPRRSRFASRTASEAAALAAVGLSALLAGCGSNAPRLAESDAAPLVTLSHRIAGEGACAQARDIRTLQRDAARLVSAHHVPSALRADLARGVSALAARTPLCLPAAPPVSVIPPSPPPAHGHGHGHGKHGHGHGGKGDEG